MKGEQNVLKKIIYSSISIFLIVSTVLFARSNLNSNKQNASLRKLLFTDTLLKTVSNDVKTLGADLILYFRDNKEKAETDILRTLAEIKALSASEYTYWDQVIKYWKYVDKKMVINTDKVPTDLPTDDSVCILTLGAGLKPDGSMTDELVKRLTTSLNVAKAYPNSFIAVTGGPTASENKTATEGGQMAKWLLAQGVDSKRVLIEDKAMDTVENCQNVYNILKASYPQVNKIIVVTSDYHIPRGSILMNTQALKAVFELGDKTLMQVISNSAPYVKGSREADTLIASSLSKLTQVNISGTTPKLSTLTDIKVDGNMYYFIGETPKFGITAYYKTGSGGSFNRNVTDQTQIGSYDNKKVGKQTVSFSYTENGVTKTTTLDIIFAK